ncbi:MAG: DUF2189 domain-containing protein [Gammaproteobacteria bacterium]|nr:MAG: DUF2189 domain-containing protein [Gammaproteobacteria bacterium]
MQTAGSGGNGVPLYAPCRKLSFNAPLRWLTKGWQDFQRAPLHSLVYGAIFVFIGWLLLYLAWTRDNDALIFSLLFGFLLVGPVLSFGLYDISHQLEQNREPSFRHERQKAFHEMGHELMLALMLGMMFVILATVVSMVMWTEPTPGQASTTSAVSFSSAASLLIAVIFAGVVFCGSAFALPMILHQDADATTALITSINAVLRNIPVMAFWALLIFVLTAAGFATALIGLAVIVPVLGYATWHAYRETIITKE